MGVKGLNPYIISNGENSVVECTLRLYANSINGKQFSQFDVHHGNYNPSCKAKSNMQEDSDGPMTRVRAKQLQRALTSQI